jgi:uncharacterized membrane protein
VVVSEVVSPVMAPMVALMVRRCQLVGVVNMGGVVLWFIDTDSLCRLVHRVTNSPGDILAERAAHRHRAAQHTGQDAAQYCCRRNRDFH